MATFSIRINTLLLVVVVLMGAAIIAMLATRAYGGPLDPSGPPAATDGVREAGTPISSLPFVISQGGYYYVTRPLTGGIGQSGITISASNVTLDLGGFTLGGGTSAAEGVSVGALRNVTVRNGAVRGWSVGIDAAPCGNCRFERVQASSNVFDGIRVGAQSVVEDCNASLNGQDGIEVSFGTVRNCTISENGASDISGAGIRVGNNSLVEGNRVNTNYGNGILATGDFNTIRYNDASNTVAASADIIVSGSEDVLVGNVACDYSFNSSTQFSGNGNSDREGPC